MNEYPYDFYDDDASFEVAGPAVAPKRRARLTSYLPIRFDPATLERAKRLAIADGRSVSGWVRRLVEREVATDAPWLELTQQPALTSWTLNSSDPGAMRGGR